MAQSQHTAKGFRAFPAVRRYARSLGLKSLDEWRDYSRSDNRPTDIPSRPDRVYCGKGWQGFGDWLGTGRSSGKNMIYRPYCDARDFVWCLGLKSRKEYREYCRSSDIPADIPHDPATVYKGKGWVGYRDWLGTGGIADIRVQEPRSESAHGDLLRSVIEAGPVLARFAVLNSNEFI